MFVVVVDSHSLFLHTLGNVDTLESTRRRGLA
jgi:hypothetical protein